MKKFLSTCHSLMKGNETVYWLSLVSQVFMGISQIFLYFLTKVLVDTIEGGTTLAAAGSLENAVIYLITGGRGNEYLLNNAAMILSVSIVVAGVVAAITSLLRMNLRSFSSAAINSSMQLKLFDHLERLPFSYYKKSKSGDLIQTCTRDLDVTRKFLIADVSNLNWTFWICLFCLSILMSISWELTVVSLALFPIMFAYSFFLVKEVRRRYRATDDSEAIMTDKIAENLAAVRIVKAFNNEKYEIDSFEKRLDDYKAKFIRWRRMSAFFFSSSDIFVFGSKLLSLLWGIYLCYIDEINAGTLVLSFIFINMMVWPLREVATTFSNMGQYLASVDRIRLILEEPIEDTTSGKTPKITGNITFDHVNFRYEDARSDVLHDVSFSIKEGQTIAIMGKTGSGKSTLSLLLTRLYDPTGGHILVNGVDIIQIQKAYLRRNIVPVLQDPFLFSKSISENILMANQGASFEEVRKAAHVAAVDHTIEGFKNGYDTAVGEKGISLSGGQKQRVAIARTIVSHAPVLIFDDSLSAVDTATDLEIRNNLKQYGRGITTLIITHRVSTAKDADLIVVLENGKISEKGTHEQLLAQKGLYQRIALIQGKMV